MLSRRLTLKLFVAFLFAFLLLGFGDSREVSGDCNYSSCAGYNINDPFGARKDTTTLTASKAGRLAIYWKGYNVLITLKHKGVTYPELDTSTFPVVASLPKPLRFGLSQVVVQAGDTVEMWIRDKSQGGSAPPPPWYARGWAPTGTGGAPSGYCGFNPWGKNNAIPYRDFVLSRGEPIVKSGGNQVQCWGDWDPFGESMDANDGVLIMSYDPNDNPKGFHDGDTGTSSQCRVFGWACDPDKYSQPLSVHIYEGGTFLASTLANISAEPGVAAACGGNANHRFSYIFPSLSPIRNGNPHTISVFAINIDSAGNPKEPNPLLSGSPKTMTCASAVEERDPWVKTTLGDIHANNLINFSTLPPSGQNNADYIISARGSITRARSARNWIIPNYPERRAAGNNTPVDVPDYDELWSLFGEGQNPIVRSSLPSSGSLLNNRVYRITSSASTPQGSRYTVPANRNVLIFVEGNLRIRNELFVPNNSSTIIFIVRGSISFDAPFSLGGPIEDLADGVYIAEGNINTVTGSTGLTTVPFQLLVRGALISLRGTVNLNRRLSNNTGAAEEIRFLPKYTIFPKTLSGRSRIFWREVEPLPLP